MTAGVPASPWTAGRLGTRGRPRLLFGATYEDAALDAEILRSCRRVFAIGAAGDTAMRLAGDARRVTAVDVNPAQVAYLRDRMRGGQRRRGAAERLVAAARWLSPAAGWTPRRVEEFLRCCDLPSQLRYFDRRLDTRRFRALVDAGLSPAALLRTYHPAFVGFLPAAFGAALRARLARGIATHPNATNPYARLLFAGQPPVVPPPPSGSLQVRHAEAIRFLATQPRGAFDGFTLSNLLDGPGPAFRSSLAEAVARAGAPAAPVVLRTLRAAVDADGVLWATRDRSMIWGAVIVTAARELPAAVRRLR